MPKHSDLFKSLAFLSFLLANLWFLTPVHAQVGGCFERFFAEGKELLAEKNFEMARKKFLAAQICDDLGPDVDIQMWIDSAKTAKENEDFALKNLKATQAQNARDKYDRLIEEGQGLLDQEKYNEAIERFEYALMAVEEFGSLMQNPEMGERIDGSGRTARKRIEQTKIARKNAHAKERRNAIDEYENLILRSKGYLSDKSFINAILELQKAINIVEAYRRSFQDEDGFHPIDNDGEKARNQLVLTTEAERTYKKEISEENENLKKKGRNNFSAAVADFTTVYEEDFNWISRPPQGRSAFLNPGIALRYQAVEYSLDRLLRFKAKMRSEGLLGSIMAMKSICLWRTGFYAEAQATALYALYEMEREPMKNTGLHLILTLLPDLITIENISNHLDEMLLGPDKTWEESFETLKELAFDPDPQMSGKLENAMASFEEVKKAYPNSRDISYTMTIYQLICLKTWSDAMGYMLMKLKQEEDLPREQIRVLRTQWHEMRDQYFEPLVESYLDQLRYIGYPDHQTALQIAEYWRMLL